MHLFETDAIPVEKKSEITWMQKYINQVCPTAAWP